MEQLQLNSVKENASKNKNNLAGIQVRLAFVASTIAGVFGCSSQQPSARIAPEPTAEELYWDEVLQQEFTAEDQEKEWQTFLRITELAELCQTLNQELERKKEEYEQRMLLAREAHLPSPTLGEETIRLEIDVSELHLEANRLILSNDPRVWAGLRFVFYNVEAGNQLSVHSLEDLQQLVKIETRAFNLRQLQKEIIETIISHTGTIIGGLDNLIRRKNENVSAVTALENRQRSLIERTESGELFGEELCSDIEDEKISFRKSIFNTFRSRASRGSTNENIRLTKIGIGSDNSEVDEQ